MHVPRRRVAALWTTLALAASGCGESEGSPEGAYAGCQPPDRPCSTPLGGSDPFGAVLGTEATFELSGGGVREAVSRVEIYFPEGRVSGAPVVLSGRSSVWGPLATGTATLGIGHGAEVAWSGRAGLERVWLTGRLIAPDQGIRATLRRDFAAPGSDVERMGEASATLCPMGALPPARLAWDGCVGPTSPLRLQANAPLDPDALQVTVGPDGTRLEAWITEGHTVVAAPAPSFAPGEAVAVEVEARDLVGRPFEVESDPPWLRTEARVEDLDLLDPPPEGAVAACGPLRHEPGRLVWEASASTVAAPLLVGLPDPGEAQALRLEGGWEGCLGAEVAVVGADGSVARSAFVTSEGDWAEALPLPPGRPLWLFLSLDHQRPEPQSSPVRPCRGWVDRLGFE